MEQIAKAITELSKEVAEVEELMQTLIVSNNSIADGINSLSATSEELNASTQDVCETSTKNVTLVDEFAASLSRILDVIKELTSVAQ